MQIRHPKGFSLVELSVILSIAATVAIGYLTWYLPPAKTAGDKAVVTTKRLNTVREAIETFRIQNSRLPCPATKTLTNSTISYDDEALTVTPATGITCATTLGMVPTRALGLPAEYTEDGWGRRLIYHVSTTLCGPASCNPATYATTTNIGNITVTVKNEAGTTLYTQTQAAFVLVSHGNNGYGAYWPSGTQMTTTGASADELENADADTTYVSAPTTASFDDLVIYETKTQIESLILDPTPKPIPQSACDANATALSSITATIATSMRTTITGLQMTDPTSNVYNTGDQAVVEMMWILQSLCASSDLYSTAKVCPGGAGIVTYDATTDTCICPAGNWAGGGC